MSSIPVVGIFDIGKTNKKVLVFDSAYNLLHEHSEHLPETVDDDGDPCEDVHLLTTWIKNQFKRLLSENRWVVRAVNASAYGASFVHLDTNGSVVAPLYNYLKPLSHGVRNSFHKAYPDIWAITASPDLDNLNSGIQLYMIKHAKPGLDPRINMSLHLPQYVAYLVTGEACSDLTSLGCHTAMWDFSASRYAEWVYAEELAARQAEVKPSNSTVEIRHGNEIIYSGIGLHDSSAALIPYLAARSSPFCLISTGTWSITLNPFNHSPLTDRELAQDCLCYLSFEGTPVKAARLFSGHFHDTQAKILGDYFHKAESYYKSIERAGPEHDRKAKRRDISQPFVPFDAGTFSDYESAYLFLVEELVARQVQSTNLVITDQTNDIFVDGGFSNNVLFMTLLAKAYPNRKVYAANVPQASALGAAIAIHSSWNPAPIPKDLLKLKSYSR